MLPLRANAASVALSSPLAYPCALAILSHSRVVLGEEPWLARSFGPEWEDYSRRVPRWLFHVSRPS